MKIIFHTCSLFRHSRWNHLAWCYQTSWL